MTTEETGKLRNFTQELLKFLSSPFPGVPVFPDFIFPLQVTPDNLIGFRFLILSGKPINFGWTSTVKQPSEADILIKMQAAGDYIFMVEGNGSIDYFFAVFIIKGRAVRVYMGANDKKLDFKVYALREKEIPKIQHKEMGDVEKVEDQGEILLKIIEIAEEARQKIYETLKDKQIGRANLSMPLEYPLEISNYLKIELGLDSSQAIEVQRLLRYFSEAASLSGNGNRIKSTIKKNSLDGRFI